MEASDPTASCCFCGSSDAGTVAVGGALLRFAGVEVGPAAVSADCGLAFELRAYADAAVADARPRIDANLRARFPPCVPLPTVDVAFPGAAYFSVACGGLAEVRPTSPTLPEIITCFCPKMRS